MTFLNTSDCFDLVWKVLHNVAQVHYPPFSLSKPLGIVLISGILVLLL